MKANAPERIWIDHASDLQKLSGHIDKDSVEYIRKDAFIEKATLWLLTNASDYVVLHNNYDTKEMVKDFVDAMKGE